MSARRWITGVVLAACAAGAAGAAEPVPPPWQLPAFDGAVDPGRDRPPAGTLDRPARPDAQGLFDLVLTCYPTRSWWRPELGLEARVAQRATTRDTDTSSDAIEAGATYAGIVARIPLYSAAEVDRERTRELARRGEVATAIADFGRAIAGREIHRRELAMYRAIERRAARRVAAGVAETAEQVQAMRDVSGRENEIAADNAALLKARLQLVGMCKDRGDVLEFFDRWQAGRE